MIPLLPDSLVIWVLALFLEFFPKGKAMEGGLCDGGGVNSGQTISFLINTVSKKNSLMVLKKDFGHLITASLISVCSICALNFQKIYWPLSLSVK